MDSFTGLKALRKKIELILQKLNMYQEKMYELSREELLEIMANENLDLSWIASQESVDRVYAAVNKIGEALVPNWGGTSEPEPDVDNLSIFKYIIDGDVIYITGFVSPTDDFGQFNNVVIHPTYTVDGTTYTTKIGNIGTCNLVNQHITSLTIDGGVIKSIIEFGRLYIDESSTIYSDSLTTLTIINSRIIHNLEMFKLGNLHNLTNLTLQFTSTTNIENSAFMFRNNRSLKTIDLSSFSFATCTNSISMFEGCSSLETLDLSTHNFSKVSNAGKMFAGCTNLKEILVSRDRWIPASASATDMFKDCGVGHVTYVD